MSYPKRSVKPEVAKAAKVAKASKEVKGGKEPQQEKDKVYGVQQREELKGLLVSKFKAKYSNEAKIIPLDQLITSEVLQFLAENTVTGPNLELFDSQLAAKIKEELQKAKEAKPTVVPKPETQAKTKTKSEPVVPVVPVVPVEAVATKAAEQERRVAKVARNAGDLQEDKTAMAARQKDMRTKMKNELDMQIAEKKRLQEAQRQKDREAEQRQLALENELEQKDKLKDRHQKQVVMQQKKEAQMIFECEWL
jgi:hypothetical protein